MSDTKQTGGPAFPAPAGVAHITDQGMTLRDYFAAKAMQAMLAHPDASNTASPIAYASAAYEMADAMLEARK